MRFDNTTKKAWLGAGLVLVGMAVFPVVGAQIWQNGEAESINALHASQSKLPSAQPVMMVSIPQTTIINQADDYHGNQNSQTVADCQFSRDAIKAGVKHYRFAEPNPADLVTVGGRYQLHREAAAALQRLQAAAGRDGVSLPVGSAFRSVSYQQGIVNRKKAAGQSDAQIFKVSSAAGYSEHHTGYALDFSPINNSFADTKAYEWLQRNAAQYGWEQSFTPQSTRNTHVAVESWHWKYKGSPAARAALANDVCYFRP